MFRPKASIDLYKCRRPTRSNPKRQVWQLRWFGTDGKRYCETIGGCARMTKLDAQAIRREHQSKIDAGLAPVDRPRSIGLKEFLRRDREAVFVDRKRRTIKETERAANHAIAALGPDQNVQRIEHSHVGRLKRHLKDKGLAPASITKVIRYLQGAFTRGLRHSQVVRNPFAAVELPMVQRNKVAFYETEQVEALVEAARGPWWKTLIRLAFTSGLRQGELLNLLWEDVDFARSTVTVAPKAARTFQAGGRQYPIFEWTAKDYETRVVRIPKSTVEALRALRDFQEPPRSAYLFLSLDALDRLAEYMSSHDGDLPDKLVNNITRDFASTRRRAEASMAEGVDDPEPWTATGFHALRKSYGTVMAQRVRPHELQRLFGHSDIKTTMSFYVGETDTSEQVEAAFKDAFTSDS